MLARGGQPIFTGESPWGEVTQYLDHKSEDLFAVNLESPLGSIDRTVEGKQLDMNLCADESLSVFLKQGGIDLVTTANNHAKDCTASQQFNTIESVEDAGLIGVRDSQTARYVPAGDQTVAFLNINDYSGGYDLESYVGALTRSRDNSDLVVVSIHWGSEYQAGPLQAQEQLAQVLVDAGADLVWGHHPHVLQRMEWMTSTEDGHKALVMYSLGNLLSDQWMLEDALRTALIRIAFNDHQVREILIIPLQMDAQRRMLIYAKATDKKEILDRLKIEGLQDGKDATVILVEGDD